MHQRLVTLAFPFPHGTQGASVVKSMEEACREVGLEGTTAKLGPHATIIPPFYCTKREMMAMAILTRLMWKWNGGLVQAHAIGVDVFEPPDAESNVGAVYVSLNVDEDYRHYVERHKINWPFPFKYPPARRNPSDRTWIPHLSVIEGPDLHLKMKGKKAKLNRKLGELLAHERLIDFNEPILFERQGGRWEQVQV
jgi:hypothetical protein